MSFNTARWRSHPQVMHLKAAFVQPVTVFARRVNQGAFTYPIAQLTYDDPDGGTGAYTDVEAHMTLAVYSSADVFKGFLRVRKTPTSSILYVGEVSRGDIDFADNDKLVVYDDWRLWARIPRMTSDKTFYKDYDQAYDDEGDEEKPIANTGPHYAGDVDPDTGYVDVDFDASNSFRQAFGIGDTLTYLWDFQDGAIQSGSTSTAQATVRFNAGQRWTRLIVTDLNGNTATAHSVVLTRNTTTYPPIPVTLQSLSGSLDTGWECSVSVLASDVSDLLPGTLMLLYADTYYDGTLGTVNGYADREHILFTGWLTNESLDIEPFQSDLLLTARSALGVLQTLPAFTATLEKDLWPTQWHQAVWPNWFKSIIYLMHYHSTLTLVCDIERPSFWTDYLFVAADFLAGTIYDQLTTEAKRGWCRLTEDKNGRLYLRRSPHLMDTTERAALAATVQLVSTDWREAVSLQLPAYPRTGWLRGGGFETVTNDLKLSLAPGDAPGQGATQGELNGMWVTDQDELNTRLGHAYAWENNNTPEMQIILNHQGGVFDPGWQEAIGVTLDSSTNRRAYGFSQSQFILKAYDITHDGAAGTTTEVLTLEALTAGAPATTQPVPDGDWEDQDWTPPDFEIDDYTPPPPEPIEGGSGLKSAIVALNVVNAGSQKWGAVSVADNLLTGTWSTLQSGLPTAYTYGVPIINYINTDPFSPDTAILFTNEGGIYRNTTWKASGAWSTLVTPAALLAAVQAVYPAMSTIEVQDACLSMAEAGLFYLVLTEGIEEAVVVVQVKNYGVTINVAPYKFWFPLMSAGVAPLKQVNVQASNVTADKFYLATRSNSGDAGKRKSYLHIRTWGTWTPLSGGYAMPGWEDDDSRLTRHGTSTFVPYFKSDGTINNPETEIYYLGADEEIKQSVDGGTTFSTWSLAYYGPSQEADPARVARRDMFEVQGETNEMAFFVRSGTAADGFYVIARGANPTSSGDWTKQTLPTAKVGWVGGWPFSDSQFYLGGGTLKYFSPDTAALWVTQNAGASWTDITHNLRSLSNYAGNSGLTHRIIRLSPHTTET